MRLVLISGLSGSGKSVALHMLEDVGYYCVDNIPAGLLPMFVEHTVRSGADTIDSPLSASTRAIGRMRSHRCRNWLRLRATGLNCDVVFLRSDEDALLKRYSETRRRHPVSKEGLGLAEAIEQERELLKPIANAADLIIDTTRTSVHELRELIRQRVDARTQGRMSILFESFAYRQGIPGDADYVFDARSLPNPFWEPGLAALTGRDAQVAEYLGRHEAVKKLLADITGLMEQWIPKMMSTNRSYLTIAIGCTGGQHRSVYLVERLAEHFAQKYPHVIAKHQVVGR